MIKIKVFIVDTYEVRHLNISYHVSDYAYNTYLFGILISSVTVRGINNKGALKMFGNKII